MAEDHLPTTATPEGKSPEADSAASQSEPSTKADSITEQIACLFCGQAYPANALNCPRCGAVRDIRLDSIAPEATYDFTAALRGKGRKAEPRFGTAPLTPATIMFDINGKKITMPTAEVVILGRLVDGTSAEDTIDLTPFGAVDMGVSRRHAQIRRKGTMAFVADIGSANGTWLNGQRLNVNGERLLRNGDELQLGLLKLTVHYDQ